ncbi:hypothetical protein HPP92_027873 [Vanilla planifolia]|uniref:Uncharacterized protein n=1 Tax=Vanilla planifolia TaxID=51239 RepID=A0A835P9I2_VANPL|nr:hypothetical protein HPP92_027873 [Vanilla planifolia]
MVQLIVSQALLLIIIVSILKLKLFALPFWVRSATAANPFSGEHNSESDPSRSELLEALCHSQTRARKAEMEAWKAYDEKEHIVKLLFRQASHLFAYKQWLQMLQLESICLQLRIKDHQISTIFPVLPWMPLRGKPIAKHRSEMRRKGRKQKKCSLCRYAFILAVGLGLASAGFLLGYCLSWLSP